MASYGLPDVLLVRAATEAVARGLLHGVPFFVDHVSSGDKLQLEGAQPAAVSEDGDGRRCWIWRGTVPRDGRNAPGPDDIQLPALLCVLHCPSLHPSWNTEPFTMDGVRPGLLHGCTAMRGVSAELAAARPLVLEALAKATAQQQEWQTVFYAGSGPSGSVAEAVALLAALSRLTTTNEFAPNGASVECFSLFAPRAFGGLTPRLQRSSGVADQTLRVVRPWSTVQLRPQLGDRRGASASGMQLALRGKSTVLCDEGSEAVESGHISQLLGVAGIVLGVLWIVAGAGRMILRSVRRRDVWPGALGIADDVVSFAVGTVFLFFAVRIQIANDTGTPGSSADLRALERAVRTSPDPSLRLPPQGPCDGH